MKTWLLGAVCILVACSGDDSGTDGLAREVPGACLLIPGNYVLHYEVLDTTASCEGIEALADEYITVTKDQIFTGAPPEALAGCVNGEPAVDGCFSAYQRDCSMETPGGRAQSTLLVQIDYAEGKGQVRLTGLLYSGTVLLDSCVVNMAAEIHAR